MKKLLYILLLWPVLLIGQTETSYPYIDLSEYHDVNRIWEMVDSNYISLNKTFNINNSSFNVVTGVISGSLTVDSPTFFVDNVNNRVGIGTLIPDGALDIVGSESALIADIHNTLSTGISAWQVINDLDRRASFGIAGSANAFVTPNSLAIYQQGYGPTYFIIDGNQPFIWSTDPTDTHLLQYDTVMMLWPDGALDVDSGNFNAVHYTDTYWDDLRVPLTNTRINPANSEPDFEDRGDGLFAWGFDSDSDSSYILNFTAQGSHARADSTDEEGHFHWQPDGTNTGNVLWRLVYSMANEQSDWTPIDTLWALDAADGVALKHQIIDFGTLVGSDTMRISHAIVGNISRVGEDARDTYTGTAFGIELDFHYQIDAPGSKEENVKY